MPSGVLMSRDTRRLRLCFLSGLACMAWKVWELVPLQIRALTCGVWTKYQTLLTICV